MNSRYVSADAFMQEHNIDLPEYNQLTRLVFGESNEVDQIPVFWLRHLTALVKERQG